MARMSSADVGWLLAGGYSILGDVTTLDDEREAVIEDATVLGVAWEAPAYVGVKRWKLTQNGFYNDVALGHNVAMVTPGASKVVAYAPEGNTVGAKFVGSPTVQGTYNRQISRGALHKASVVFESEGNHDEGKILATLAARTTAGNTQSTLVDNAGSSANGGAGYLELTALTLGGYTDIIVKISHSADNVTFVPLITFTAITAAPAAERKTVTGTVNRYLAAEWAYTGSGSSQTATWFAGFARN